jgi:hypothetical protein
LSVGDHIYLFNHGLYKVLLPGGSWQGEHALVTDCGNREVSDDSGFRFQGHGLPHGGEPGSLPRFYSKLLKELNTFLYRSFRIGGIFLHYMKSGGTAFPGDVTKATHTLADPTGTSRSVDFYLFDLDFSYPDERKRSRTKTPAKTSEHGFVVWHIAATKTFGIHRKKTIAAAVADGLTRATNRAIFRRRTDPATAAAMFDPVDWVIPYPAPDGSEVDYAVYQRKGSGLEMRKLIKSELYAYPFFRFNQANAQDMWMTRPKVDVGSTYTSFLTTNGAI